MTEIFVLIALAILSLAFMTSGRLIQSYMLRAVYRQLPENYVPANQLADSILAQLKQEAIAGVFFRLRCRDRIPILMMFDTLHTYGFAECDLRPDQKIEEAKETILMKTEVLAAKGLDHARASAIRKLAKCISIPQASWRKKASGRKPGLLEFLPT